MYCKRPESLVFVNKNKVNFTGGSPPCCSCRLLAYFFYFFSFSLFLSQYPFFIPVTSFYDYNFYSLLFPALW